MGVVVGWVGGWGGCRRGIGGWRGGRWGGCLYGCASWNVEAAKKNFRASRTTIVDLFSVWVGLD